MVSDLQEVRKAPLRLSLLFGDLCAALLCSGGFASFVTGGWPGGLGSSVAFLATLSLGSRDSALQLALGGLAVAEGFGI